MFRARRRHRSSSLFYFPCELSRSRAYSSTTQMAFRQREFLFKKKIEKGRKTGQKWAGPHDTPRRRNPVFSIYNQLCLFDFIQEKWRRFFIVVVVFLSNPQIHFLFFISFLSS
jgi:hypothetical protein